MTPVTRLPADDHVHSQFSWDTSAGDLEGTCRRAVVLGLPALSFTEHVDLTSWALDGRELPPRYRGSTDEHGRFLGAPLEVEAYVAEVARCRELFPDLRIRCGVELSEGHWHPQATRELLARGFDRVVGSVHALPDLRPSSPPGTHVEVSDGYVQRSPLDVVLAYLAEVTVMCASDAPFEVLGHIDYPLRHWPAGDSTGASGEPWDVLEDPAREALRVLAGSGRALEVNTSLPLDLRVVRWWREAGGDAVAFGSDAHRPEDLARRFRQVAAAVEACGFRADDDPTALWGRA